MRYYNVGLYDNEKMKNINRCDIIYILNTQEEMVMFKFSKRDCQCAGCKLTPLSNENSESLEIQFIKISNHSIKTLEYVLNHGTDSKFKENQELDIDELVFKKEDYEKFVQRKRYSVKMLGFTDDAEKDKDEKEIKAVEIKLGNVDITFNELNVKPNSEYVIVGPAHMILYPLGEYKHKNIED